MRPAGSIAVVLDGYSPTMLADANQYFARQGVPGFAPGQYTEDFDGDNESADALGSADAGGHWLIGYTGAVTDGVYGQVAMGGGTSGASPIVSGLEADAEQASGHAVGFANPAIYQLAGTPAISDILPVNLNDPPLELGPIPDDLQSTEDYLIALDQDDGAAPGYDDATGVGAVTPAFVTSFTTGLRADR